MDNIKILFVYPSLKVGGYDYTQSHLLMETLGDKYQLDTCFAIFPEDKEPSSALLKNEIISETDFLQSEYDVLFIESAMYDSQFSGTFNLDESFKIQSKILKAFFDKGKTIIFSFGQIDELRGNPGVDIYNEFLHNSGLPSFRKSMSTEEFPDYPMFQVDVSEPRIMKGYDEINAFMGKSGYNFNIKIDEGYLKNIPIPMHPIYDGIETIAVVSPVLVDTMGNRLVVGNPQTQLLATGDLRWDGASIPTFGSYNDFGKGCGIILPMMFADSTVKQEGKSNIRFLDNLIKLFVKLQRERMETSKKPSGLEVRSNDDAILPFELYKGTRGNIENIANQINRAFQFEIYDGCAVLMRKLIEMLLILSFQKHNIEDRIQNDGNYVSLGKIVKEAKSNRTLNLTRPSKDNLRNLIEKGNLSAHNPFYQATRRDIESGQLAFRQIIEELFHKAGLKE